MGVGSICRIAVIVAALFLGLGFFRRSGLLIALSKWAAVFRWSIGLEKWAKNQPEGC